jgi:hypothetical protein
LKRAEPVLGWHWLKADRVLRSSEGEVVKPGKTYTVEPPLRLCRRGLHASRLAVDSLAYAPGPVVCRVELFGQIAKGPDKLCATHRRVLWMADAAEALEGFACDTAAQCLKQAGVQKKAVSKLIQTRRLWAAGAASEEEFDAAWDAAWDAFRAYSFTEDRYEAWRAVLSLERGDAKSAARKVADAAVAILSVRDLNKTLEARLEALANKEIA